MDAELLDQVNKNNELLHNLNKSKKILVECDCGCEIIKFDSTMWDGKEVIEISAYASSFYAGQAPGWNAFKDRIKMIWFAITGKQFRLYDIILAGDDVQKFKEQMKEFVE